MKFGGLFLVLFLCIPLSAGASAWTQEEGQGQIITTATSYYVNSFFNAEHIKTKKLSGYRKYELDIYAEYGLSDPYTLGISTSLQHVEASNQTGGDIDNGLADTEIFLRERVWSDELSVLSLQQSVSIPGPYDDTDVAALGYGQFDIEMRVLYGENDTLLGINYFTNTELAYRFRFDSPADEVRLDYTFGVKPAAGYMLLFETYGIAGMGNESGNGFATSSAPNYSLFKARISGVIEVDDNLSLQVGYSKDIAGRDTGAGNAFFVGLWQSF